MFKGHFFLQALRHLSIEITRITRKLDESSEFLFKYFDVDCKKKVDESKAI